MILSFTGHRKLFDQYYPHKKWNPICAEVVRVLEELKPELILSGGALGFDSLAMDAALALNIPYRIAVPFRGQETIWPYKSQERYRNFIDKAESVVIVSDGGYSPEKMETRNRYLIDNSDLVLACLDPNLKKSGTLNCVRYADSKNKKVINVYHSSYSKET